MDSEVCPHWLHFLSGFDPTVKPLEWAKSDMFNNMLDWHCLLMIKSFLKKSFLAKMLIKKETFYIWFGIEP